MTRVTRPPCDGQPQVVIAPAGWSGRGNCVTSGMRTYVDVTLLRAGPVARLAFCTLLALHLLRLLLVASSVA